MFGRWVEPMEVEGAMDLSEQSFIDPSSSDEAFSSTIDAIIGDRLHDGTRRSMTGVFEGEWLARRRHLDLSSWLILSSDCGSLSVVV
jgi:hypothetical protein